MQIDLRNETALSLADAARAVPPIDGKRPHVSTLWRWCRKGVRGVRLEYVRLGHRIVTTEEAIARFAHRLADADADPQSYRSNTPAGASRSSRARGIEIERAEAQLAEAGI